jgi:hypothetical protein
VKQRRNKLQLSEKQQLILGLMLVILVAVSMLYCLGFASLALRQVWENAPLPWDTTGPPGESIELPTATSVSPLATGTIPP